MATVLAGSVVALNSLLTSQRSASARSAAQADLLSREAATSGQSLLLSAALTDYGFRSTSPIAIIEHESGPILVDYDAESDGTRATFSVTSFVKAPDREGQLSFAAHRLQSTYDWKPATFPGPIWIEAPFVHATVDTRASLRSIGHPVILDRSRFDEFKMGTLVPFSEQLSRLRNALTPIMTDGGEIRAEANMAALLEHYRTPTLQSIYYNALDKLGDEDADRRVPGPVQTITRATYGSATNPAIVHYTGALTVEANTISGHGILIVEGGLHVQSGGRLEWDGIVLIRSQENTMPVVSEGALTVRGAVLLSQVGAPPGGHMDLTVWRDHSGTWTHPYGNTAGSPWRSYGTFPWFQHTHKFDEHVAEGQTVYLVEAGRDRHEQRTTLRQTLTSLGSQPVYLELANTANHGLATFELDVAGHGHYTGRVRDGWGDFTARDLRTQSFRPDQLRTLIVDVRSLRMLRRAFDGEGSCDSWPFCIGARRDRHNALAVRLRRQSDNVLLYELSLYWHSNLDEREADQAEEQAWREQVASGEFGTVINLGQRTNIEMNISAISLIGRRLGFAAPELTHTGSFAEHWEPGNAAAPAPPAGFLR